MSNKQIFTSYDVYGFKCALALHSAKNNALIAKYEQLLELVESEQDNLYSQSPSDNRDKCFNALLAKKSCYRMILDDLRKPCDLFISEFEHQNVGKEL